MLCWPRVGGGGGSVASEFCQQQAGRRAGPSPGAQNALPACWQPVGPGSRQPRRRRPRSNANSRHIVARSGMTRGCTGLDGLLTMVRGSRPAGFSSRSLASSSRHGRCSVGVVVANSRLPGSARRAQKWLNWSSRRGLRSMRTSAAPRCSARPVRRIGSSGSLRPGVGTARRRVPPPPMPGPLADQCGDRGARAPPGCDWRRRGGSRCDPGQGRDIEQRQQLAADIGQPKHQRALMGQRDGGADAGHLVEVVLRPRSAHRPHAPARRARRCPGR